MIREGVCDHCYPVIRVYKEGKCEMAYGSCMNCGATRVANIGKN